MDEDARHGIMESCLRDAGMRLARPPIFRCAAAESPIVGRRGLQR